MNTKKILKEASIPIEDRLYYFKRHLTVLRYHLWEIIVEGFDYFNPCDYDDYESYIKYLVQSCALTLINSYDELQGKGDTDEIEEIITQYIKDNYIRYFNKEWKERECDEDINESVEDNKKERSDIETYILRRVPWNEILEGLDDGIKWAERRCQKYGDNVLTAITLERFGNMVMSVLMDNILLFLKDEVSQEILHYGATENYLRNLFSNEISKSYNKIIN